MVKAYSRYNDTGAIGLIHCDTSGASICWSSNGKSIFSATGTRVTEFNAKTGAVLSSVSCSRNQKDEGMFSSALSLRQPSRVASLTTTAEYLGIGCSDGSVRIMNLPLTEEESEASSYQGHRGPVNATAFSEPSGLVASGGRDTEIVVWDLVGESAVCRLTGHKGEITCLSFLPGNPDFLVSGSKDGVVKIWSVKLQLCVQTITEPRSEVWSIGFAGADKLIVGASDKVIYTYQIQSNLIIDSDGLTVAEFFGQLDRPEPADGRVDTIGVVGNCLFAQTDRRVVEMWRIVTDEDEKTKRMKRRIKRKSGSDEIPVDDTPATERKLRASDSFVVASSIENPSVAMRYVANAKIRSMAVNPVVGSGSVIQVALGLQDNSFELFKIETGDETANFAIKESRAIKREGHRTPVGGLSVSSNGNRLVSVSSESVIVWNAVTLAFQRSISSPSGEVVNASFVPGDADRIALFTRDGHCCVLDINSGSVCGIPIKLWGGETDPETPKKKRKQSLSNEIRCVSMYMQENEIRFLIGEKDRRVSILKLDRGQDESDFEFSVIASHELPDEPVSVCIAPKGYMYIATGLMNGNVELIYSDTGKHYMSLYSHKLAASAVAFSPDDQVVISGSSDKTIKVWSVKFGNVLKTIKAHDSGITNLMFIPYSHLVFSTARDGVLSLWDIDRFERVMSKVNHPSAEVLAVAASGDAGMVFTSGSDRAIRRITRGEDQMFIEEEAEKAMEIEIEGEAQRDDLLVAAPAATKSSIESVRLLERVVQMIEIDEEELGSPEAVKEKKRELVKFVCTELPMGDLQQVAVTLPTGHARQLLAIIAEVMEESMTIRNAGDKSFPLGFPVEQCVTAGLYLVQAQAKFLVGEPHSRPVLLKLKDLFHFAVHHEIQHVGTAAAGVRFL